MRENAIEIMAVPGINPFLREMLCKCFVDHVFPFQRWNDLLGVSHDIASHIVFVSANMRNLQTFPSRRS